MASRPPHPIARERHLAAADSLIEEMRRKRERRKRWRELREIAACVFVAVLAALALAVGAAIVGLGTVRLIEILGR